MSLERSFVELAACLRRLSDALQAAQITIEDRPIRDPTAIVERLGDDILDALG